MLFYLLFALALVLELRARVPLLVSLSAAILPLAIVGLFRQPSWPAIFTLLDPLLLEFLTGVVLGVLVRRGLRLATVPEALLATAGLIGLFTLPANVPGLRECVWGVAALALVSGTVLLEPVLGNAIPALILRIGDASYSLYLVHMLLIFALGRVILKLSHTVPPEWLFVLGSTLVCTITALLLYRLVERPMTLALGRWTSVGSARSIVGTEHLKPIG